MVWEERMRSIERNGESELKQKLPTPASRDNGIKMVVVVVVVFVNSQRTYSVQNISYLSLQL